MSEKFVQIDLKRKTIGIFDENKEKRWIVDLFSNDDVVSFQSVYVDDFDRSEFIRVDIFRENNSENRSFERIFPNWNKETKEIYSP